MKKVETLNEYKELLRQNKSKHRQVDTNCFLMSSVVGEYITKGCLFAEEYNQGLILFIDEGSYFNLHYFWESGTPLPNLKQNKPVVIEELNNNGSRDAYLSQFEPFLIHAGFSLLKNNLQVAALVKESDKELRDQYISAYDEKKKRLEAQGFRIRLCMDDACMEQVVSLWESALPSTDIPNAHKVLDSDTPVMCIFDSENTLCSAKWWHHSGKISEGRHVVTNPNFERRGLGSTIQLAWIVDGLNNGVERFITWIADSNEASHAMHKRTGFLCNGRSVKQYILK